MRRMLTDVPLYAVRGMSKNWVRVRCSFVGSPGIEFETLGSLRSAVSFHVVRLFALFMLVER